MFVLKLFNVIRETDSEAKKQEYISQGYELISSDVSDSGELKETDLKEMTVEELLSYAATNNIDVGKATSKEGILSKINTAKGGGVDGESNNT